MMPAAQGNNSRSLQSAYPDFSNMLSFTCTMMAVVAATFRLDTPVTRFQTTARYTVGYLILKTDQTENVGNSLRQCIYRN